jgi:TRAP-type C4-dicarboxylate transport system permease small subunit
MPTVLQIIDRLNKYMTILLGILLAIMSIVIIFQVFSRYLLSLPLPWSEELSRYIMIYTVFFGAALALRYQKLIAVEVLAEKLSWKNRRILKTVVNLISIAFFILLLVKGIEMMTKVHLQISPALQLPMSIPYASIPIGAILLIMNAVAVIIEMYTVPEEAND